MVIGRGDLTDIALGFEWLEMNCLITLSLGRSVDNMPNYIKTRCFEKPQTKQIGESVDLAIGNNVFQGLGGAIF